MAEYTLLTPSVDDLPGGDGIFRYFAFPRGRSLLKRDDTWTVVDVLPQDDLEGLVEATDYFFGGYEYVVDEAMKTELEAAGLGVTFVEHSTAGLYTALYEDTY